MWSPSLPPPLVDPRGPNGLLQPSRDQGSPHPSPFSCLPSGDRSEWDDFSRAYQSTLGEVHEDSNVWLCGRELRRFHATTSSMKAPGLSSTSFQQRSTLSERDRSAGTGENLEACVRAHGRRSRHREDCGPAAPASRATINTAGAGDDPLIVGTEPYAAEH